MDTRRTDIENLLLEDMQTNDELDMYAESIDGALDMISPEPSGFFDEVYSDEFIDETAADILDDFHDELNF